MSCKRAAVLVVEGSWSIDFFTKRPKNKGLNGKSIIRESYKALATKDPKVLIKWMHFLKIKNERKI